MFLAVCLSSRKGGIHHGEEWHRRFWVFYYSDDSLVFYSIQVLSPINLTEYEQHYHDLIWNMNNEHQNTLKHMYQTWGLRDKFGPEHFFHSPVLIIYMWNTCRLLVLLSVTEFSAFSEQKYKFQNKKIKFEIFRSFKW